MGMTQELLALVTGLAHYLKILIRIALTGALKLEREHNDPGSLPRFLDRLQCLALAGADPSASRTQTVLASKLVSVTDASGGSTSASDNTNVAYGFRSLGPDCAGESPFGPRAIAQAAANGTPSVLSPPSDLCASCKLTVEEDCVRLGTYQRWHSHCVRCVVCGKVAAVQPPPSPPKGSEDKGPGDPSLTVTAPSPPMEAAVAGSGGALTKPPKISSARRPPANVADFVYEVSISSQAAPGNDKAPPQKLAIYCTSHATLECHGGFSAVSRLEQYAFLLNVALRRLYLLLHKRGVMVHTPCESTPRRPRDCGD